MALINTKLFISYTRQIIILTLLILSCSYWAFSKKHFLPKIGVCTNFEKAGLLALNGYTYIESGVGSFLVPLQNDETFDGLLEQANKSALPIFACNSFIPGNLKSVGPDAVPNDILKYAETAFLRAQKAGVEIIVFGSGGSRSIPDGFSREEARKQFVRLCVSMGAVAKKYGITVVVEPLNSKECNFINSVGEGGEIVKEINHPNIQLLADIYHMMMDNESAESILNYGKLIKHVHVAEKEGRAAPGTHNEDLSAYYKALKQIKYKGKMSVECRWENLEAQAGKALEKINHQINQLTTNENGKLAPYIYKKCSHWHIRYRNWGNGHVGQKLWENYWGQRSRSCRYSWLL